MNYFHRLFAENKTKRELMPIHLVYIIIFSYFCAACENNEFCYYIFSHNSFNFLHEDQSMCEFYAIRKMRYMKNLRKHVYTLLIFCVTTLCDTWKCVLHTKAGCTLSVFHIWHYFRRLFARNKTKRELMPIHLAYIMLFSYLSIECEN